MAYTNAQTVKTYLGVSGTGDDTLIGGLCERAQAVIDAYCGRTFEASANETRYFDPTRDVIDRTLYFGEDCASISTVTNGDSASIASTSYVTEPRNGTPYYAITLKASSGLWWTYVDDPENAIQVSAKWAYSTTAPDDIVQAATRLAAYLYRQKDAQIFDTTASPELGIITVPQGIPRDVAIILAPYRRIR